MSTAFEDALAAYGVNPGTRPVRDSPAFYLTITDDQRAGVFTNYIFFRIGHKIFHNGPLPDPFPPVPYTGPWAGDERPEFYVTHDITEVVNGSNRVEYVRFWWEEYKSIAFALFAIQLEVLEVTTDGNITNVMIRQTFEGDDTSQRAIETIALDDLLDQMPIGNGINIQKTSTLGIAFLGFGHERGTIIYPFNDNYSTETFVQFYKWELIDPDESATFTEEAYQYDENGSRYLNVTDPIGQTLDRTYWDHSYWGWIIQRAAPRFTYSPNRISYSVPQNYHYGAGSSYLVHFHRDHLRVRGEQTWSEFFMSSYAFGPYLGYHYSLFDPFSDNFQIATDCRFVYDLDWNANGINPNGAQGPDTDIITAFDEQIITVFPYIRAYRSKEYPLMWENGDYHFHEMQVWSTTFDNFNETGFEYTCLGVGNDFMVYAGSEQSSYLGQANWLFDFNNTDIFLEYQPYRIFENKTIIGYQG